MKYSILIFALVAITAFFACSGTDNQIAVTQESGGDNSTEILDVARRQASRFVEIAGDDMTAQGLLLDVRSKETQLRRAGCDNIADDYIDAFTAEVRRLNPTLADTTFVNK